MSIRAECVDRPYVILHGCTIGANSLIAWARSCSTAPNRRQLPGRRGALVTEGKSFPINR